MRATSQHLFDAQKLIVLGHPLATARSAGFDFANPAGEEVLGDIIADSQLAATAGAGRTDVFMPSVSPSSCVGLMLNRYYKSDEEHVFAVAEAVYSDLTAAGFDVLYDDRPKVSPGVKFGDAELIGVPVIVIVGRDAADGTLELWDRRSGERRPVAATELAAVLRERN